MSRVRWLGRETGPRAMIYPVRNDIRRRCGVKFTHDDGGWVLSAGIRGRSGVCVSWTYREPRSA